MWVMTKVYRPAVGGAGRSLSQCGRSCAAADPGLYELARIELTETARRWRRSSPARHETPDLALPSTSNGRVNLARMPNRRFVESGIVL
jgi:hypothetical protein